MSAKPQLAFQPAPRPRLRVTPDDAKRLQEATQDLGFGRTTSAPDFDRGVAEEVLTVDVPAEAAVKPAPARMSSLKLNVPDTVWNTLRLEALKRRVTVKYLILEALAARGYDVDLSSVSEDGRRER